jgi:diaminopimelate epimerase
MSYLPFSKYSGCGNDFVLIDNRHQTFPIDHTGLITKICQRKTGAGADGLVLLESSSLADFKMRIFNADGSEAEMCGNGIRCLMQFLDELGFSASSYLIETKAGLHKLTRNGQEVSVSMPLPSEMQWNLSLSHPLAQPFHFINTGVPHAVFFVENLQSEEWMKQAPLIRHHPYFGKAGTNVNFAHHDSKGIVHLRTYERGVEEETLACGTGAVATALAVAHLYQLTSPITILPLSKDPIKISIISKGGNLAEIHMRGPAIQIYRGEWILN